MQGIEERDTESGIHVFRVHFTADPWKRSEAVQEELARGMPGGRKGRDWRREMMIDWSVGSGIGVYVDVFERNWHVASETLLAHPKLPMYRGWDIGPTHAQPACVFAQLDSGQLRILDEVITWDGRDVPAARAVDLFAEDVIEFGNQCYPGVEFIDYADSAGWTKSMTDNRSAVDILRSRRIYPRRGPVTFQLRRAAMDDRLQRQVRGHPALLVSTTCSMVIEGLSGSYQYEQIGETGRHKGTVEKNAHSHPMNALEYIVGGLYVPERATERERGRVKKRGRADSISGY